jgi:hypothetical protein
MAAWFKKDKAKPAPADALRQPAFKPDLTRVNVINPGPAAFEAIRTGSGVVQNRRGSKSSEFGLHKRAETTGLQGSDFSCDGVLFGRREPPRVKLAGAEAVPGRAG